MFVLNWHNQNPNITTALMLITLLHWLFSKLSKTEFSHQWQQWICHCVCSLVHIYIEAPKIGVNRSLWLRISDKPVHMSHVIFILHDQATHIPSFFSLTLITGGGRCNLWNYTLFSFLQFPIIFSHKILRPDQHCCQTQSTVFPQCHRPSVTPTVMQILCKHTHMFIFKL